MSETIRIIVADDTDIAREGLRRILAAEIELEIVGEGATVHETIRKVHEMRPDILIMDLKWFGNERAGIEAIRRLTKEVPQTKVIAITIYPDLIDLATDAGAAAALNKAVSRRQLIEEIRSIYALPPAPSPSPQSASPSATPVEELTKREFEVLMLLAEGMTDREVAHALGIAESTAKNHVSNILGKLDVPNRAGAVAVGYQLGLIGPSKN